MAQIEQLKKHNIEVYPVTISSAVICSDGTNIDSKLNTLNQNYSRYANLIDSLNIEYSVPNKQIVLKLDNTVLSTINSDNFAISGVLNSSSYNPQNGILTLGFTDGNTVNIDLNEILQSILESYTNEIESLRRLHTTLSESAYEALAEKDPNVYYYTYEDE